MSNLKMRNLKWQDSKKFASAWLRLTGNLDQYPGCRPGIGGGGSGRHENAREPACQTAKSRWSGSFDGHPEELPPAFRAPISRRRWKRKGRLS